jgi:RND superfamily putative drug exporter
MGASRISSRILRRPWLNVAIWIGLAVALGAAAPDLRDVGTTDVERFLPDDVPSRQAQQLLDRGWPNEPLQEAAVIVLERQAGLTPADASYVKDLQRWITGSVPEVASVQSTASSPEAAQFLRSPDKRSELVIAGLKTPPFSAPSNEAVASIRRHLRSTVPDGLRGYVTGPAAIGSDQITSIQDSFDRTAIGSLILILLILLYVYRSPVAALIPLTTIGVAFVVARSVVGLMAGAGFQISSQVETFMVVMVFGAGTDYVLFLLSRYREERRRGGAAPLGRTIRLVGEVVVASGATVTLGFLSQLTARFGIYKTMGPAIGIAVAVTVAAALTLTPAIAALLGRHAFWPAHPEDEKTPPGDPRWAGIARWVTQRPAVLLGTGVLLLAVPAAFATGLRTSFDILEELPAGIESRRGFEALARHFPPGRIAPAFVLLREPGSVTDDESFATIRRLTERIRQVDGVAEVRSAPLPVGRPITFDILNEATLDLGPDGDIDAKTLDLIASRISSSGGLVITPDLIERAPPLRRLLDFFISADGRTARLMVAFDTDPFSTDAIATLQRVEEVTRDTIGSSDKDVLVAGPTAFYSDIRRIGTEDFRWMMALVILIVLAVFGLLLRSLVAPLYLLATVLLSFAATLGATVAIFQGLAGHDGISLWVPPFLFIMLVALGADYNIFLMSRVTEEYRRTGDVTTGVQRGLELTGRVITSAGLILAGTFAVLLLAPMPNLKQIGFAITFGILLDTFVLRTLLVPSATVLLGPRAWWPRTPSRTEPDDDADRVAQAVGGRT